MQEYEIYIDNYAVLINIKQALLKWNVITVYDFNETTISVFNLEEDLHIRYLCG